MGLISFLFFQCKTAFNMNTCHLMSNISQLLPPFWYWWSGNSRLLQLSIVSYLLGDLGQASCYADITFTRKSHNCSGTAFVLGDSAGGSKFNKQTLTKGTVVLKLNQFQEFHSVFYVTLQRTLVSQYLQMYRMIFY